MEIISRVNWVDLLVVIIMLRTIYVSFQDGLSHSVFPLFGSILKLVLALHFYSMLGSVLHVSIALVPVSVCNMASFLAIILIMGLVLKLLKNLIDAIIKVTWHPLIEKIGGVAVGALRGAVSASIVLIFLALVPLSYLQWSIKDKSLCGMFFLRAGPAIYRTISGGRIDDKRITEDIVSKKDIPVKGNILASKQPKWEQAFNTIQKKPGGAK